MTSMIEQAETVATDPPVNTYKKTMELASKEQLAMIDEQVKRGVMKEGDAQYTSSRDNALQVVSKYDDMAKKDKGVALFSVTSVCDFVASCMMMIAAGSERIEALKAAIRGKKNTTVVATDAGDKAYRFYATPDDPTADNPGAFEEILRGWCQVKDKGNGVVQFKFPAAGDFHTFAVERICAANAENKFIVYQAYQNTYSLAHFLGQSPDNDKSLKTYHEQVWNEAQVSKRGDVAIYKTFEKYYNLEVKRQFKNITTVAANIGKGQALDANELKVRVIKPLADMLRGEINKKTYVDLTGSSTKTVGIRSSLMIVLMCNQISPDKYEGNRQALYQVPGDLTGYVT